MLERIKSLTGFAIGATDGAIGKLKDVYFDDQRWAEIGRASCRERV